MSLLYKALNQASQQRERSGVKADPLIADRPVGAAGLSLADQLLAQGRTSAVVNSKTMRVVLFALIGAGAAAIGASLLFTPDSLSTPEAVAPPTEAAAPPAVPATAAIPSAQEPPPAPVAQPPADEIGPSPAGTALTQQAPDDLSDALETEAAALAADPAANAAPIAPPTRIGAAPTPSEAPPQQKRVREGGLENYISEQLKRDTLSGLQPPVHLDKTGQSAFSAPQAEITNDTEILRERYESAAIMLEKDQPQEALSIYEHLLRNNPGDRLALLGRATALQKLGRNLQAVSAFEDVLTAFPGDEWALVNLLGLISAGQPQTALQQMARLARLHPSNPLIPAQTGMLLMDQGDYEMAARSLERALSLDPGNVKYVFNLAVVYDRWGQRAPAVRYYRQSLELAAREPASQIPVETVRGRLAFLDRQ
ncbi:MAG: tetratricopeptide repeat protein [Pseudomonadota bacterium]|jgi:tetratricopeptide (TPR) repeat protein